MLKPKLGSIVCRFVVSMILLHSFGEVAKAGTMISQTAPSTDTLKAITDRLDTLRKRLPIEKVYLHTNKPSYNLGDTLWFKGYVTDGNGRPSKLSGLLYVELNDDSTEAVRRISLPIKEGAVRGQIALSKVIFHEGAYTLRAYTNWQQNLGADYYFNQRFYLAVAANTSWLARSVTGVNKINGRDQLDVDLKLRSGDNKPLALKDVEVKVYEGKYYLFNQNMRTGVDGSLKFSKALRDSVDIRFLRIQITSLDPKDKFKQIQIPVNVVREQRVDLQFLPEGGKLVAGLRSRVGFKAIGEDGRGVNVAGDILDSKGNKVASFASAYKGMGNFGFVPLDGQVYTARLNKPNAVERNFPLPAVSASGAVIFVDAVSDSSNITINLLGIGKLTKDSLCYLIGTSNGRIYYTAVVDGSQSRFSVPKMNFPTGVARFTLLKGRSPLIDRVVFIDHKDRAFITVPPNKIAYGRRDSVSLTIAVKDRTGMPLQGNFSLSVTDNGQVKADTAGNLNIAISLLLKAGLKGAIESPGYYFDRPDTTNMRALDNLMLTQGWVGYDWKNVFGEELKPKFALEKELRVTGSVVDLSNKPMVNAPVIISSQKPSFIATTETDANGRYTFKGLPKIDSGSFFLQANNKKGKYITFGELRVERFRAADVPDTQRDVMIPWYVNSATEQLKTVTLNAQKDDLSNIIPAGTLLRNVDIKTVKRIKGSWFGNGFEKPIAGYDEKDIQESAVQDLYHFLKQKVSGFKVMDIRGRARAMVDGRWPKPFGFGVDGPNPLPITIFDPTSVNELIEELSAIKMATFKGVEIYLDAKYLRPIGAALTSKTDAGWFKNVVPGTATYRPLPVMQPQMFYSPRYKVGDPIVGTPDYRSAIYWSPDIYTDVNGMARVSFCTSDLPANYTINIQGNTPDGELGSAVVKLQEVVNAPGK